MMDVSSMIDGTLVFIGVVSILVWAWSTLDLNSNTVSTGTVTTSNASPIDEGQSWRLAA